ncbi:MAG: DUF262 domain-containing protein [Croceibacterium sp.]
MDSELEEAIDSRVGEVRFDAVDFSFGEIASLHRQKEIVIDPEYQRLFRWSNDQRSRLIESVLLGLPLPQIFLIENQDGVLELIDGLQRVSSVLQFLEHDLMGLEPLLLSGCDVIPALNGLTIDDLNLSLRLRLKRSPVRAVIIRKQSKGFLKYEMFKRLNTGGSALSAQEVRNCSLRMIEGGADFYGWLQQLAAKASFLETTATLSETDRDQKADEELVVRYLALKSAREEFKGSVRDWLDTFLEQVLLGERQIDRTLEEDEFDRVFGFLQATLGEGAFVKYRESRPIGALAPAFFEAVTMGVWDNREKLDELDRDRVQSNVIEALQSAQFRAQTGPGANSRPKLEERIRLIAEAVRA